uniref:Uncharacterized protein n=1 Tax=Trypanosoma congolense (strain IL3000) TaxID=1068625 RepID=G0UPI7_TRYCI|nr:conserved hypothetical protein [Trypanosoma congolense IL3000]
MERRKITSATTAFTVNEAPWLTRWVEAISMVVLFLICCFADLMKCKNHFISSCAGNNYRTCLREPTNAYCDDVVLPASVAKAQNGCGCGRLKLTELLLHVLEVDLGDTSGGKKNGKVEPVSIAPFLSTVLRDTVGDTTVGGANASLFVDKLFVPLREAVGLSQRNPSQCVDPYNTFHVFHSYDTVTVSRAQDVLEGVAKAISFQDALRNLTGTRRVLDDLYYRKRHSKEHHNDYCALSHLVVIVIVNLRGNSSWPTLGEADNIPHKLMDIQSHIRRSLSRSIREKKQYRSLLGSVSYVTVPMGIPFQCASRTAVGDSDTFNGLTKQSYVNERKADCGLSCKPYKELFPLYWSMNDNLEKQTKLVRQHPSPRTFLLPYSDYFSVVNGSAESEWADCFTPTRNNVMKVARLIARKISLSH